VRNSRIEKTIVKKVYESSVQASIAADHHVEEVEARQNDGAEGPREENAFESRSLKVQEIELHDQIALRLS
jgi:hypothetical protein